MIYNHTHAERAEDTNNKITQVYNKNARVNSEQQGNYHYYYLTLEMIIIAPDAKIHHHKQPRMSEQCF